MTYPITIIDDFFEDPDAIVEIANNLKYYPPDIGNWPGVRTKGLHLEDNRLFTYVGEKIHLLFHDTVPDVWELQLHFQKIKPFHKEKYHKKNRGWIHQDIDTLFGGIVYLNKDTEPDTGTSVYKAKYGYSLQFKEELQVKEKTYLGDTIPDEDYEKAFDASHDQYIETVKVENVYNRFVLFNNKTHHGVKTFGTKERLTLNFFGMAMAGKVPPLLKAR